MGGKEFSLSTQELFDFCRKGSYEKVNQWILQKTRKSKLNFLRSATPNAGWIASLRDPTTAYTALHYAALNGFFSIVSLLAEQDDQLLTARDRRGCLPIHLAAWNGHDQIVQYLFERDIDTLDDVNNAKESCLHLAAQHGHGKVVALLLQKHANARLRNARFETALDIAARTGKENVCRLLICYCPELALQSAAECSRADTKTPASHVVYPLHVAARHGHLECLRVLCDSGFDVNYVTEAGTALHVAALFGRVEAVKILLQHKVDVNVRDSQGKTVLEKLEEHENHRATDLTQIMQSREGWSDCRRLIEAYMHQQGGPKRLSGIVEGNEDGVHDKDVIWRTLPENSKASNLRTQSHQEQRQSSGSGKGIYYPPSMTVEHVTLDNDMMSENNTSTMSLSTNAHSELNTSMTDGVVDNASGCSSVSPSIASTSSQIRITPKFPVTSPNSKTRHVNAHRFGSTVPINGVEPVLLPNAPVRPSSSVCTYQPPPVEASCRLSNECSPEAVQVESNQYQVTHSYRNVPMPYDNAPLRNQRMWEHNCGHHEKQTPIAIEKATKTGTVGTAAGKSYHVVRDDGTQTIPAARPNPSQRPTVLNGVFVKAPHNKADKPPLSPTLPPKPRLKDSQSTDFSHLDGSRGHAKGSGVTFAPSSLKRSLSPNTHSLPLNGKAPLALPEEISGSTCTSIMSMSPERVLNPIDERLRRSMTTTSEDRTLVSMHADYSPEPLSHDEKHLNPKFPTSSTSVSVTSPESVVSSEPTVESSCSLPQISQISSSSISPTQISDATSNSGVVVSMRPNRNKRSSMAKSTSPIDGIDQVEEWRKIEDILSAIRRDSLFAENNGSQVAVSVRNRKSQALTLQLSSVAAPTGPESGQGISAAVSYPEEVDELTRVRNTKRPSEQNHSAVVKWLIADVGLPVARSVEIGSVLEENGFDSVDFMKGSISRPVMTEMGIDKSIQHQISLQLNLMVHQIPSIADFDYASDWLNSLQLIDYLGAFAKRNLTQTKAVYAANLSATDLKRMGIRLPGHLNRVMRSLYSVKDQSHSSAASTISQEMSNARSSSSEYTLQKEHAVFEPEDGTNWEEKTTVLMQKCATYTAHYLGSAEISNVEGAEDCRRAMNTLKSRIRQIAKVPQVLLEISVGGVNVLDSSTNRLTVQHEINKIQVVCQDELDLNCFAYIFQDGDKNFCHVYCVLTAEMAREIIMTLGHAFNLAFNMALGNTGSLN